MAQLLGSKHAHVQRICAGRETAWLVGIVTVLVFLIMGGLKLYLPGRNDTSSPVVLHGNIAHQHSDHALVSSTGNQTQGSLQVPADSSKATAAAGGPAGAGSAASATPSAGAAATPAGAPSGTPAAASSGPAPSAGQQGNQRVRHHKGKQHAGREGGWTGQGPHTTGHQGAAAAAATPTASSTAGEGAAAAATSTAAAAAPAAATPSTAQDSSMPAAGAGAGTGSAPASAAPTSTSTPDKASAVAAKENPADDGGRDPAAPASIQLPEGSHPWRPLVVGHRGASAKLPEHTAEAYTEAVAQGADFIECDVVLTKDLVPICRHSPWLSNSTNADELFKDRITTKTIDGQTLTGVFASDLTHEEVGKLRARQPLWLRDHSRDDTLPLVSLEQFIGVARSYSPAVGVYPEVKHAAWHNGLPALKDAGATIEDIVLRTLRKHGYGGPINSDRWLAQPVYIQSFDAGVLRKLAGKTCIPLMQLVEAGPAGGPDPLSDTQLAGIAKYADAVGPDKRLLARWNGTGYESTGATQRADQLGLLVHAWTVRDEAQFVMDKLGGDVGRELDLLLLQLQVDGVFADSPKTAVEWLNHYHSHEWHMAVINKKGVCRNEQGAATATTASARQD